MDKTESDSKEIVRSEELTDPSLITLFDMEIEAQKKTPTMAYLPSFFTTASLPFKNVHKPVFVRKGSNGITLTLSSPKNVPFGKYGRLLLSILTTHAVLSKDKNQSVLIEYKTLAELLRELQLPKQRGKDIKEQLECFSNATFAFDIETKELKAAYLFKDLYEDGNYPKRDVIVKTKTTGNIRFTNGVQFQEIEDETDVKTAGIKVMLSPEFSSFCQRHAVPIDYGVYKDISSPVGKDIYAWLVYRNNGIEKPTFIPREKIVEQFMPVNENLDKTGQMKAASNNYNKIIGLIKEIKQNYYQDLNIGLDDSGVTLYKSPTPILKDDTRYALITSDI